MRKAALTNSNKSSADINHRKENSKQEYYGSDKHIKIKKYAYEILTKLSGFFGKFEHTHPRKVDVLYTRLAL